MFIYILKIYTCIGIVSLHDRQNTSLCSLLSESVEQSKCHGAPGSKAKKRNQNIYGNRGNESRRWSLAFNGSYINIETD